ncbi:MAG: PA14 domain-containing protein, partial [bacterium]|nr:PA14 domain-containing protein [bacterium]
MARTRRRVLFCETLEARRLLACDTFCLPGELVEAETGILSGRIQVFSDASASAGQYVAGPSGTTAGGPSGDYVQFIFDVQTSGDFVLEAFVEGPTDGSNSFFVTINDQPSNGYLWDIPVGGWTLDRLSDRGNADPVTWSLGVGQHSVRIHLREGGSRIDAVRLAELSTEAPVASPGEIVEAESAGLQGRFAVGVDPEASSGKFVSTPATAGSSSPGNDYAEFLFDVINAGDYRLEANVDGPAGDADSFFVTVDAQPSAGYLWDISPGWTIDLLSDRNGADPVLLTLGSGLHSIKFHLREGGARLDYVRLVEANPSVPVFQPGEWVEAEAGLASGRFVFDTDPTASAGQFAVTPTGAGASSAGNDFVEFVFQVQNPGNYTIEAIVDGPNDGANSFFVTVDGASAEAYLWDIPTGGWTADFLSDRGGADPVILNLDEGQHTIRFHLREGGTKVDALKLVELNPTSPPLVPGDIVEAEAGLLSGRFAIGSDPFASANQYISTPVGITAAGPGSDFAEYVFDIQNAGIFKLDATVSGPTDGSNSFFVTIDDQPVSGYLWDIPVGDWTSDTVSDRGGLDPVLLSLDPGLHQIRFHLREGGSRLDSFSLTELPAVRSEGTGITAEYFDNQDLTNRTLVRTDPIIDFNWGAGSPDPSIEDDSFSVRWTGRVEPLYSEIYTFEVLSDDGIRVWVDDQLIIDEWYSQLPTVHTGIAALTAGQLTPIRIEYFAGTGDAAISLSWSSQSQPLGVIPSSQLYEAGGDISLATSLISIDEDAGSATIIIRRDLGSEGTATVDFRTQAGTATEGADYQPSFGTAVFETGVTEVPVVIPIINDDDSEAAESLTFTIDNVTGEGTRLLAPRTATVTIIDDDTAVPEFPDFSDSTSLVLNGSASIAAANLILTDNSPLQAGSAFFAAPFRISSETSFETQFQFQIGGGTQGGNGFAFVLQNSVAGAEALGPNADGLGYAGIDQSLAIEFDTFQDPYDIDGNHISVLVDGDVVASLETVSAAFDLNNDSIFFAWIDYNGSSDSLAIYLATSGTKPANPVLTASADLNAILGGSAYLGFSAGTGVSFNEHAISSWQFQESAPPIIPPPLPPVTPESITVVSGLSAPIAIDWSDNSQNLLIAEKRGVVRIMRDGNLLSTPFIDISSQVNSASDRGLLDIAVHPNFAASPYIYLLYTYDPPEVINFTGLAGPDGKGNRAARLIRVLADASTNYTTAVPGSEEILLGKNSLWENFNGFVNSTNDFDEPPAGILPDGTNIQDFIASDSESHSAGAIEFGPDGALYVTIGDGTSYNQVDPRTVRVQDVNNL